MAVHADETDVMLVAAMAGGDRAALGRLYDRHSGTLLAIGIRMMGSRETAEDLLHDVLLEAWRRSGDYDSGRGSVRGWLSMRMRSRALDRLRSRKRTRTVSSDEHPVGDRPAPVAEDPALGPDRTKVVVALRELPENQRSVLELAYFGGLSSSQIAERLQIPAGTVKSRTAAALRKLRGVMSEKGGAS
jgi:RNA polymerase sigma-70 factor, ECF subfamily